MLYSQGLSTKSALHSFRKIICKENNPTAWCKFFLFLYFPSSRVVNGRSWAVAIVPQIPQSGVDWIILIMLTVDGYSEYLVTSGSGGETGYHTNCSQPSQWICVSLNTFHCMKREYLNGTLHIHKIQHNINFMKITKRDTNVFTVNYGYIQRFWVQI